MGKGSSGKGFVVGAALGALVGAIGGILYAPKKGEETRKELKGKIGEYGEKVSSTVQDLGEKGKEMTREAKELGAELKEKASSSFNAVAEKVTNKETEEKVSADNTKTKRYFKGVKK